MKLVPGPLPPIPTNNTSMDRLPLPLPFSPDFFWRYPLGFHQQPPSSPLLDYKSQLPSSLASDPRIWSREDVTTFLRWAEREFDLQPIDMDMFQMNGKAMCLLTRTDLSERAPGSGDVLHNVLQILVREANSLQRMLPSSPVTPTSRHPYPLSPHSNPPTPSWNILSQNSESAFHSSHAASLAAHLMAQSNSVTLSPAPSIDSQSGSPQHADNPQSFGHSIFNMNGSSGSNPSDSDEDAMDSKNGFAGSPPNTPSYIRFPQVHMFPPRSPKQEVSSPGVFKREFFPNESPEPNTNGRLLWDFLQQLLNDPSQRYTSYIAWKNRDTGVFKIVDPAGLAKLWGIQKNHLSMNYDKMSRALRYYYRVNILRKVQGERHCYQFLRNPSELKNIKNISLLRQQMSINSTKPSQMPIKPENLPQITIKPETHQQVTIRPESHPQITIKPEGFQQTSTEKCPQLTIKPESQHHITIKPEPRPAHQVTIKPEPLSHEGSRDVQYQQQSRTQMEYNEEPDSRQYQQNNGTSIEYNEGPTDLSMDGPRGISNSSRQVNIVCSPDQPPPITGLNH